MTLERLAHQQKSGMTGQGSRSAAKRVVRCLAAVALLAALAPSAALASRGRATRLTSTPLTGGSANAPFTVSGHLRSAGGHGIRGQHVGLYWEPSGAKHFQRLHSTKTNRSGRYSFTVTLPAGSGALAVRFAGSRAWRAASSVHAVTIAAPPAPAQPIPAPVPKPALAPTPKPAPASTPAPKPAPTAASAAPPDPTTTTSVPMENASEGILPGPQECAVVQIARQYPTVTGPTGMWIYAIDKLYTARTDGSIPWHLEASGPLYYNGTNDPPVFDWFNLQTGQAAEGGQAEMDVWTINSGWTAAIIQYVWDEGVWYDAPVTSVCSF